MNILTVTTHKTSLRCMSHNGVLCRSYTRYDPLFAIAHTITTALVNVIFLIVLAFSVTEYIIVTAGDFAHESRAKSDENAGDHMRDI